MKPDRKRRLNTGLGIEIAMSMRRHEKAQNTGDEVGEPRGIRDQPRRQCPVTSRVTRSFYGQLTREFRAQLLTPHSVAVCAPTPLIYGVG